MTKVKLGRKSFVILVGLALLAAFIILEGGSALSQSSSQSNKDIPPTLPGGPHSEMPTRPAECVPLPYTNTYLHITLTPTPDLSNPNEKIKPYLSPTVTPIAVTRTINLSPKTNPNDLARTYVFRCNGDMDLYISGPDVDIDKAMDLKYGDVVIFTEPPISLMGKHPPKPSPLPTQIFPTTVTSIPYPAPDGLIKSTKIAPYPLP